MMKLRLTDELEILPVPTVLHELFTLQRGNSNDTCYLAPTYEKTLVEGNTIITEGPEIIFVTYGDTNVFEVLGLLDRSKYIPKFHAFQAENTDALQRVKAIKIWPHSGWYESLCEQFITSVDGEVFIDRLIEDMEGV